MLFSRATWLASAATLALASPAAATIPYAPVTPTVPLALGPDLAPATQITGKEYSHDFDTTAAAPGGLADPEQVLAWDGSGGTADGLDYSGSRVTFGEDRQVDAIAHRSDFLYGEVFDDQAHLVFSHDDEAYGIEFTAVGPMAFPVAVPSAGPISLSNGNTIGGTGELSFEKAGAFSPPQTQGLWASQSEVNGMPFPGDVDGVELWGAEPPSGDEAPFFGNADKYSLEFDWESGVSIWNASGTPYLPHAAVVSVVTTLLGPITGSATLLSEDLNGENAINLDAMMVFDEGQIDVFDNSAGISDSVLFSINQIVDRTDASGYYATGSELFFITSAGGFGFLDHGGHTWDKGYALTNLMVDDASISDLPFVIDVNAIEAILSSPIPEPASMGLLVAALAGVVAPRRRPT